MSATLRYERDAKFVDIGDRRYPVSLSRWKDVIGTGYDHRTRNVVVPMENGLCLSIAYGSCMYGSNYDHGVGGVPFVEEPTVVEVACWFDRDNGLMQWGTDGEWSDNVQGYIDVAALPDLIDRLSTLPTGCASVPFLARAS